MPTTPDKVKSTVIRIQSQQVTDQVIVKREAT